MSADHEPHWQIFKCTQCASMSKFDTQLSAVPTCPTCGSRLDSPEPVSELAANPVLPPHTTSTPLIAELGRPEFNDPQLDEARLKSTAEEQLYSDPEQRVRVKRSSKRVQKELTEWDTDEKDEISTDARRRERRVPQWQKILKIAAVAIVPASLLVLTVYGVIAANKDKKVLKREPDVTEATIARASMTPLEAATLDRNLSKEVFTRASEISEKFLNAQTWEDRLFFVREPERVRPLMEEFYARPENTDGPIPHRPIKQIAKTPIHQKLILLQIETEDFDTFPIAIERDDEDEYRVDWESFVGYGKYTWKEMMEKRPTEPFLLRARIVQRPYYNYGFQDDTHMSWQLEDRKGNHRVYGYVERRGSLHLTLTRKTKTGIASYVLLRVRYPEDARSDNQLEIIQYVAQGWVAPAGK